MKKKTFKHKVLSLFLTVLMVASSFSATAFSVFAEDSSVPSEPPSSSSVEETVTEPDSEVTVPSDPTNDVEMDDDSFGQQNPISTSSSETTGPSSSEVVALNEEEATPTEDVTTNASGFHREPDTDVEHATELSYREEGFLYPSGVFLKDDCLFPTYETYCAVVNASTPDAFKVDSDDYIEAQEEQIAGASPMSLFMLPRAGGGTVVWKRLTMHRGFAGFQEKPGDGRDYVHKPDPDVIAVTASGNPIPAYGEQIVAIKFIATAGGKDTIIANAAQLSQHAPFRPNDDEGFAPGFTEPPESYTWLDYVAESTGWTKEKITYAVTYMNNYSTYYAYRSTVNGQMSFCYDPTQPGASSLGGADINSLSNQEKTAITLALYFTEKMGGATSDRVYMAGQYLAWEIWNHAIDPVTFEHNGTFMSIYNGGVVGNGLTAEYEAIKAQCKQLTIWPSFLWVHDLSQNSREKCSYIVPEVWTNGAFQQGKIILEDANGVVDKCNWTNDGNFSYRVIDASHLEVTINNPLADWTSVGDVTKIGFEDLANFQAQLFGDGKGSGKQDMVTLGAAADPFVGRMRFKTSGNANEVGLGIYKADSEGSFLVSSTTANNIAAKYELSGPTGTQIIELPYVPTTPGNYSLHEVETPDFADEYLGYTINPQAYTFSISESKTTWDGGYNVGGGCVVADKRQKGIISVQKIDAAQTYLNHMQDFQEYIECTVCHENFLTCVHTTEQWNESLGGYRGNTHKDRTSTCVVCGEKFPECGCSKEDYIATFAAERPLDKDDPYYNGHDMRITNPQAQGDATLAGAEFTVVAKNDIILANGSVVHHAGDVVAVLVTDNNGRAQTGELDLGVYTVTETKAPNGYQYYKYRDITTMPVYTVDLCYSGDQTEANQKFYYEYEDSVILGHLSITKYLEADDDNDMNDNGSTGVTTKTEEENVYYGVYLTSKGNGTNQYANLATARVRLPDEYFLPNPFDENAPPYVLGEDGIYYWADEYGKSTGEIINPTLGYHEDAELANAVTKDLYMVLRTNENGKAATYDVSTISWMAMPLMNGLANCVNNGFGATLGVKDYSVPLPYGTYTVVEFNPPEGYEWGVVEEGKNKGDHGVVKWEFTIGDESKVVVGKSPYIATEQNNHHFDITNDLYQQRIYIYRPARN